VKIQAPGNPVGNYFLDIPAMVAAEVKKSAAAAQQLLAAFQDAAEKTGVFQERIAEHCLTSEVPEVFVEYARLRDLTIVPVPEGDYVDQWCAESIIFGSGRPTIVLPHIRKRAAPFALNTVIVAWDFSRPATRAIADAMPILKSAKRVCIVTVANEKAIDTRHSAVELAKHLARHGIEVILDQVDAEGRRIGEVLEAHVNLSKCRSSGHGGVRAFPHQGVRARRRDQEHARAAARAAAPVPLNHAVGAATVRSVAVEARVGR